MAYGEAVIDGVTYLADTYCAGDASKVMVAPDGDYLNLWLMADRQRSFSDVDVKTMGALGFYCYVNEDKWPDLTRYSHFYMKVD